MGPFPLDPERSAVGSPKGLPRTTQTVYLRTIPTQRGKMPEEMDEDLFTGGGRGPRSLKQALMQQEISDEDIPKGEVEYMHDVPLKLIAQIGQVEKSMREVLNLKPNQVIEFDKVVGEPMDVFIGGRLMCRGEIVVVNERYGIRISEVVRSDDSARYSKNA